MTRPPTVPDSGDTPGEDAPRPQQGAVHHAQPSPPDVAPARRSGPTFYRDMSTVSELERALVTLREQARGLRFADGLPGAEAGETARLDVLDQVENYVLPRVRNQDNPLLIAVAGSTGAGKSTLVNSLVGEQVTTTGVRRPTTNSPVLACNPADVDWFSEAHFLPSLPRVRQEGLAMPGKDGMLVLAASECMPAGVALLDTPDVDSVVAEHHEFAAKFLDAADLWLFVTTAVRYADARIWEFLQVARDRNTSLGVVLSRVPRRGRGQLMDHFGAMLDANGLGDAERFMIPETDQIGGGRFTSHTADPVRNFLVDVAADLRRRESVTHRTFAGVLNSFRTRVPELAKQVETQIGVRRQLTTAATTTYDEALERVEESIQDASLLRGTVLARWHDVATSGELSLSLRARAKRQRKHQTDHARVRALDKALRDGMETMLVSSAQRAAEALTRRWAETEGGKELAVANGLDQVPDDFARRARAAVGEWQRYVVSLVASDGVTKRSVAKFLAYDEEAFGLVLIVGLLGYGNAAEPANGAVPQRLLKSLFGAESLRSISDQAYQDLRARLRSLFGQERQRSVDVLAEARLPEDTAAVQLYQATYNIEIAR
ncbi:50S ribosome-binding GTPase [Spiractinospora alimapuensis]|uniref:dynamin family protein n=1 Tax=Spiractinospora alimapuensis TaxID=2820884 RepID=UPI00374372C5|nr:50S ribosome-binding GTPase [Spiractinospora alimapuensis]